MSSVPEFAQVTYRRRAADHHDEPWSDRTVMLTRIEKVVDPAQIRGRVVENDPDGRGWHETGESFRMDPFHVVDVVELVQAPTGYLRPRRAPEPDAPATSTYEVTLGTHLRPHDVVRVVFTESASCATFIVCAVDEVAGVRTIRMMPEPIPEGANT